VRKEVTSGVPDTISLADFLLDGRTNKVGLFGEEQQETI
jgi:hypothetical protein